MKKSKMVLSIFSGNAAYFDNSPEIEFYICSIFSLTGFSGQLNVMLMSIFYIKVISFGIPLISRDAVVQY